MKLLPPSTNKEIEPIDLSLLDQMAAYQMMYEYCIMKIYELMRIPDRMGGIRQLTKEDIEDGITNNRKSNTGVLGEDKT